MDPVFLFDLASRHAHWAQVRQATIGGNIANANTPTYRARDIEPFRSQLDAFSLRMAATHPGHIAVDHREVRAGGAEDARTWGITHSGNTVSVEEELMKASQTGRAFQLDMSIMRSFHQMMVTSARGQ